MIDQKLMMRLARLRFGVGRAMGIASHSDIHAVLLPPRKLPHDPLAMFGYFGVVLYQGKAMQKSILFKCARPVTVPRMIRLVLQAPQECWAVDGVAYEPVLLVDRHRRAAEA